MKLFKKLLVLTISVFTLAGLASCGGSGEAEDYSKLTFEDVFEIEEVKLSDGTTYAPGLTMTQLTSKTLDGAYTYYEKMDFYLKAKYKVTIKSVTFTMATNETDYTGYYFGLVPSSSFNFSVEETINETTPTITKTFNVNPELTLTSGKLIQVKPKVTKGELYTTVGKCTIYNFSFNFEVLGK
jgi:hypothetical protein